MKTKHELAKEFYKNIIENHHVWWEGTIPNAFLAGFEAAEKIYEEKLRVAVDALEEVKEAITVCAKDTLWHGPVETTVDFIDNSIAKIRGER